MKEISGYVWNFNAICKCENVKYPKRKMSRRYVSISEIYTDINSIYLEKIACMEDEKRPNKEVKSTLECHMGRWAVLIRNARHIRRHPHNSPGNKSQNMELDKCEMAILMDRKAFNPQKRRENKEIFWDLIHWNILAQIL